MLSANTVLSMLMHILGSPKRKLKGKYARKLHQKNHIQRDLLLSFFADWSSGVPVSCCFSITYSACLSDHSSACWWFCLTSSWLSFWNLIFWSAWPQLMTPTWLQAWHFTFIWLAKGKALVLPCVLLFLSPYPGKLDKGGKGRHLLHSVSLQVCDTILACSGSQSAPGYTKVSQWSMKGNPRKPKSQAASLGPHYLRMPVLVLGISEQQ